MNDTPAANLNIPDLLIDRAYSIMSEELDHWQVVGPQIENQGTKNEREFYTAARAPDASGYAKPVLIGVTPLSQTTPIFQHFIDKPYAIAFVQWQGLKAVLADPEVQAGITKLAGSKPN